MEQSLLDGWQVGETSPTLGGSRHDCGLPNPKGSNQSASSEMSSKSPTIGGSERMSSNPIAPEESEPTRVDETHAVSWNPPDLSVG